MDAATVLLRMPPYQTRPHSESHIDVSGPHVDVSGPHIDVSGSHIDVGRICNDVGGIVFHTYSWFGLGLGVWIRVGGQSSGFGLGLGVRG